MKAAGLADATDTLLQLLSREGASLHTLLTRLTLDEHAAEDLLQELFLHAERSAGLRTAGNQAAYLRQMAIYLAFAWRRGRRRAGEVGIQDREFIDSAPQAEAVVIRRDLWERILDAAGGLSGLSREVFVRRFLEGQEDEVIAELLGKTPHQVRGLASKALAQVRAAAGFDEKEDSHVRR